MPGSSNAQPSEPMEFGAIGAAMARIPASSFVMTAQFDETRVGMLVTLVQMCSIDPPLVLVAMPKGQPIEPIIRDARGFALCQIADGDLLARKKFDPTEGMHEDPFVTLPTFEAPSGSPILERAEAYLDCELVRHFDVENSTGIYIGLVKTGGLLNTGLDPSLKNGNGHRNGNNHRNGNGKAHDRPASPQPTPKRRNR